MRYALPLVALLMAGVVFAACGSDDDNGHDPVPSTAESPGDDADAGDDAPGDADDSDAPGDGDAPDEDGFSLPESGLTAPLTDTYDTATPGVAPADADLPVPSGSVIARWYQENGLYVVYYDGLDLAVSGPLCPGNSIQTPSGAFEFVTNAPTGAGVCLGASPILQPPAGVQLCGDVVLYVTAIRVTSEGTLFGTIERYREDGTIIGLTSQVTADAAAAPDVDLSSCEIPEGI